MDRIEQRILYDKQDYYFDEAMKVIGIIGLIIHGLLVPFFLYLAIPELWGINLLASLYFGTLAVVARRWQKFNFIMLVIGMLLIVLYAFMSSYMVGVASGFNISIGVLPIIFTIKSGIKKWEFGVLGIVALVLFVLAQEHSLFQVGQFQMDPTLEKFCFYFNFSGLIVTSVLISRYFRRIVERKEQIVMREIHHRIRNNLQLLMSLTNIRNLQNEHKEGQLVIEHLQNDMYYLSAIHKHLVVTAKGAYVNFPAFVDEITIKAQEHCTFAYASAGQPLKLKLDVAIPLGIVFSQMIEAFAEMIPATSGTHLKFGVNCSEDAVCSLTMRLSSPEKFTRAFSPLNNIRFEIAEILVDQLEGQFTHQGGENEAEFRVKLKV